MSKKLSLVNTSALSLKEVWECGFDLRWLQDITLTVASGLRFSIFHSSPWWNLPLWFFVSIAYQMKRRKRGLKQNEIKSIIEKRSWLYEV